MTDFFKVPLPVFPPSCCRLCTAASDPGGFVDLGQDLQAAHPDARIYVCARCSGQLGAAFGMLAAEDAQDLREVGEMERREIYALEQRLEQAEGRGSWSWLPANENGKEHYGEPAGDADGLRDATVCECGQPKGAQSKRCRSCSARIASEARKTGTAA